MNDGKEVQQATLTWNNDKNVAEIMRIKENADDYRYFPDPDLPPVSLEKSFIEDIKSSLYFLLIMKKNGWTNIIYL